MLFLDGKYFLLQGNISILRKYFPMGKYFIKYIFPMEVYFEEKQQVISLKMPSWYLCLTVIQYILWLQQDNHRPTVSIVAFSGAPVAQNVKRGPTA